MTRPEIEPRSPGPLANTLTATPNSWNIDCDPGFHGVFCKTTIIRQLRKWNELKIGNRKHSELFRIRMKVYV